MSEAFEIDPHAKDPAHTTDSWHKHGGGEEPIPQSAHGEVSGAALLAWLLALFVGVFGAIIVLVFFFEQWKDREVAVRAELDLGNAARQQLAVDMTELNSFGWVDQANGVVHVPITQAMQTTLDKYAAAQQ